MLRVRQGDCLTIQLENLLTPVANPNNIIPPQPPQFNVLIDDQVLDRRVSLHVAGMQYFNGPDLDDGAFVGANADSTVPQGGSATYKLYAEHEGAFMARGMATTIGSDANQGNSSNLLFGQVIVEPTGAQSYRSQVTEEELRLAAPTTTVDGFPIINYEAIYPALEADGVTPTVWVAEGKGGLPVLNMMQCTGINCEIVHSEINAVNAYAGTGNTIVGNGHFPPSTYPLESVGKRNPSVPNRLEPFRDFASVWHDEPATAQAFNGFFVLDPVFRYVLAGVKDGFMINYGSGGIGSEIIANRLGVGPMHDCLSCAYEEFFLTSFTVGDPAQLTDVAANFGGLENLLPGAIPPAGAQGPKANFVPYPEDPANVHHSYTGDFVKFRNTHVGKEQHVFHLHNHQWLFNPNDDNANYLDAQGVGPGVGYTYEINFGGSGNRNKTSGDAIFHCHFYPHFAQGMWYHWRNHDVLETGTPLEVTGAPGGFHNIPFALENGTPMLAATAGLTPAAPGARVRSLPDGEVVVGAPIPAIVPLPGKPMAPLPGEVQTVPNPLQAVAGAGNANAGLPVPVGSLTSVVERNVNPGYPFWIAGIEDIVGQRPPTPPLDMANAADVADAKAANSALFGDLVAAQADGWDGGLPRAALQGFAAGGLALSVVTPIDFSKVLEEAQAVFYPEIGTDVEQTAMAFHAQRCHDTALPDGTAAACDTTGPGGTGGFILNGAKPAIGAPYHEPCVDDQGDRLADGVVGDFFGGVGLSTQGSSIFTADNPRIYKGVQIQFDAVLTKTGYHYPQQRIISLWQDAVPTISKAKPPEPFVLRNNTFDCTVYHHVNLTPEAYEIDDYQVRTPTDIIGQHIHLPKWDLTTADGAGNGWNYEDGTLAAGAVVERIEALNEFVNLGIGTHTVGTGSPAGFAVPADFAAGMAEPLPHPFFGNQPQVQGDHWIGARTTQQRWFFDPVVNTEGYDRGLGIIFTHDHYGPSTHQQIGLYATVLTEPAGSTWVHNETGQQLGEDPNFGTPQPGRIDGGPTSWQAAILPPTSEPGGSTVQASSIEPYREFYFEYTDFQHAYEAGVYVGADQNGVPIGDIETVGVQNAGNPLFSGAAADAFRFAINPPAREQVNPVFPDLVLEAAGGLLPGCPTRPCPQAIDVQDPGMFVVNYRAEPVGLRVYDPNKLGPDGKLGTQAGGLNELGVFVNPDAGDLALALQSRRDRAIPELNRQPQAGDAINGTIFPPPINFSNDVGGGDPFTPMVRVNVGDLVRIKQQAGGDEEEHSNNIHGVKWLQGGSGHGRAPNSGWRNAQAGGISEKFTLTVPVITAVNATGNRADYAYALDSSMDGYWSGMWGIMRSYNQNRNDLFKLPNGLGLPLQVNNRNQFNGICPSTAPVRPYDVTAVLANDVLPANANVTIQDICPGPDCVLAGHVGPAPAGDGTLVYNPRTTAVGGFTGPLHDPTAVLWFRTADLTFDPVTGRPNGLQPGTPVEPLILRAAAGECIEVTVNNALLDPAVLAADGATAVVGADGLPVFENDGQALFVLDPAGLSLCGGQPCTAVAAVDVTFDAVPELPTYTSLIGVTKRDRLGLQGSTTFQTNLVQASAEVGLHPQLVAYDVTRADGMVVGENARGQGSVAPGQPPMLVRWYAGDVSPQRVQQGRNVRFNLVATPVEFGGANLMPADKIKQGMKSLIGQLVIEPEGSTWVEDASSRASATVTPTLAGNGLDTRPFRDFSTVFQKGLSYYYGASDPVEHINGEGVGIPEDPQDSTHMAINYGAEPLWFRAGIPPQSVFGNLGFGGVDPQFDLFSNTRAGVGGDPATPVFIATAGQPMRMRVTEPHGTNRGTTFQLHGHVWQRDPYVCPGESRNNLPGACQSERLNANGTLHVGSRAIGDNPQAMYFGGQESVWPAQALRDQHPECGRRERGTR